MNEKTKPQTIEFCEIKNGRRITAVAIDAAGKPVVWIGGKNAQGKSSVLDMVEWGIRGKKAAPKDLVHDGAEKVEVTLRTQDWEIDRAETANGKQSLKIKHCGKAITEKPQGVLDVMVPDIGFDPIAFSRMDEKKQADILRKLVGLDLSDLDSSIACNYDERTEINRDLKKAEAQFAGMTRHKDVPMVEVSIADLSAEHRAAMAHNEQRRLLMRRTERNCERMQEVQKQISALMEEYEALSTSVDDEKATAEKYAQIDEAPIIAKMESVSETNRKVRENHEWEKARKIVEDLKEQSADLDTAINKLRKDRALKITECKMPIPGLGFSEDGSITYQDRVLSACSSAEKLRISTAIGLAANPQIAVLTIHDGSLLDSESRAMLVEMAAEAKAQLWIEVVQEDAGNDVIIIEDGHVK